MKARVVLMRRERFIVADSKVFMRMNLRAGRGKYLLDVEKAITVLQVPARRPARPHYEVPAIRIRKLNPRDLRRYALSYRTRVQLFLRADAGY